jgi:glutamate dehydrogenase
MESPTDPRQAAGRPRSDPPQPLIGQALSDQTGDRHPALIEQLTAEISRHQPPAQAEPMAEFARQFYDKFPLQELHGRALSDLYASASGGWHFLQNYDASRPKVQIFNPEFDRHGWQLAHTVIALLCRDMPFALDSVRGELNSRNISIITIHSASLRVQRDEQHRLLCLLPHNGVADAGVTTEALIYLEINRHSNPEDLAQLQQAILDVLAEVECVVDDFAPMRERAAAVRRQLPAGAGNGNGNDAKRAALEEVGRFIDWLLDDNFTFLGYEYLQVLHSGDQPRVERATDAAYGLLRTAHTASESDLRAELAAPAENSLSRQLRFSKASLRTRVHRRVYPDYVDVRVYAADGRIEGEHRFMGLYTSRVYTMPPAQIPVLGKKVEAVLARADFPIGSHERSQLARVLDVHPRDELFHSSIEELYAVALAIHQIQERRVVRLFVRRDSLGKYVSCLVFMPRDTYNTELRSRIQALLCDVFGAREAEFSTFFSESILTRTHFILQLDPRHPHESARARDTAALQDDIVQICMNWHDHLRNFLVDEFGEEQGLAVAREYDAAFPPGYRAEYDPRAAVADIRKMGELKADGDIAQRLYRVVGGAGESLRFRLYRQHCALALSDVMPILENLGLRVLGEHSYAVRRRDQTQLWIHEFILTYPGDANVDVLSVRDNFQEAFARIWHGDADNDAFNRLVPGSGLGWRAIAMLRAYARYLKQIQFGFATEYIAEALVKHLAITQLLVQLFQARFDPAFERSAGERAQQLETRIVAALDGVDNLSEDRIIRQYVALLKATLRTNYYQAESAGQPDAPARPKNYFAFKLESARVPAIPQPRPLYEIFVHSPRVEGVHLRTSRVARGGLRWSDRLEDFRTEVLGLVKAQNVKNAVIVPTGAKGGFVVRRPVAGDREAAQREGIDCYRTFVGALLDLTDNSSVDGTEPPPRVVRHDDDDVYLVVAADKGTASFSDIANEIAAQHGFWLGDAFASGGSVGYDHKKMGITARGAWISVRRHFREMGVDIQNTDFSVVGIGDMAGDVFGNGMLMSRHIRLVAAFNHQHIFIDPEPDAERSFQERERLFGLPRSSWEDYDRALISAGGGVFKRSAKSIPVSPEMGALLRIEASQLAPNELITALLKAPVDLLWNGGIGTYVKARGQSHAESGDKANDVLRVDGADLRCKVIGEGGNLGCTQPGRIEYALHGGRCNTDFIDNAAGVDCSDHEVNIKIALNALVAAGDMTEKQRRELLRAMTDTVGELVLRHNYRQTQALSLAERQALARSGEYERLIRHMESSGWLQRGLEFIPTDEALIERKAGGSGLTRPELAVLISYTKAQLKAALAVPAIADDPLLAQALFSAFPAVLRESYRPALERHRLRTQIIGTKIANDMVDLMGITFVERIGQSTGANAVEVARAFVTAREVFDMHTWWERIEALDDRVDAALQLDMMAVVMRLVRRATRWFIRNRRVHLQPLREVERFRASIAELYAQYPDILAGRVLEDFSARRQALRQARVPEDLATYVATAHFLYPVLSIIDAATELNVPARKMAEVYMALAQALELDAFAKQIAELKVENHWQAQARETFRDDLEWQQRKLAVGALGHLCPQGDVQACIQRWLQTQQPLVERWRALLMELHGTDAKEFAVFAVAIRELLDLAQSTYHGGGPVDNA